MELGEVFNEVFYAITNLKWRTTKMIQDETLFLRITEYTTQLNIGVHNTSIGE